VATAVRVPLAAIAVGDLVRAAGTALNQKWQKQISKCLFHWLGSCDDSAAFDAAAQKATLGSSVADCPCPTANVKDGWQCEQVAASASRPINLVRTVATGCLPRLDLYCWTDLMPRSDARCVDGTIETVSPVLVLDVSVSDLQLVRS
jgi:hypothetical protein